MPTYTGKDVNVFTIDTTGVVLLATFREVTIETTRDLEDVSAAQDGWQQTASIVRDWSANLTNMVTADTPLLFDYIWTNIAASLLLTCKMVATGKSFAGNCVVDRLTLETETATIETLSVLGNGTAPTLV